MGGSAVVVLVLLVSGLAGACSTPGSARSEVRDVTVATSAPAEGAGSFDRFVGRFSRCEETLPLDEEFFDMEIERVRDTIPAADVARYRLDSLPGVIVSGHVRYRPLCRIATGDSSIALVVVAAVLGGERREHYVLHRYTPEGTQFESVALGALVTGCPKEERLTSLVR